MIWAMGEPTEVPTATPAPTRKAEHHHDEATPAPATRLPSEDLFICIGFPSGRVLCMGSWWK
jgi:hypothetical protein